MLSIREIMIRELEHPKNQYLVLNDPHTHAVLSVLKDTSSEETIARMMIEVLRMRYCAAEAVVEAAKWSVKPIDLNKLQ